jgi:low affinity Fe/Cu permease
MEGALASTEVSEPESKKKGRRVSDLFSAAALWTSRQCGRASTFIVACMTIVAWAVTGPVFHYSDTWQLVINTGTTIVTFLMVFLIQNTQNRDMSALHLKLDELIRVNEDARNKLLNLEDLTEEELEKLKGTFARLAVSKAIQPERTEAAALADLEHAEEDIEESKRKIGSS